MDLLALKDILATRVKREKRATQDLQGQKAHLAKKDILDLQAMSQDHQGQKDHLVIKEILAKKAMSQDHQGQKDHLVTKEIQALEAMYQDHPDHLAHLDMMDQQVMLAHLVLKDIRVKMDLLAKKETQDLLVHLVHLAILLASMIMNVV